MSETISKSAVCEILADMYPTDGEKVVDVRQIDKAYEAIQQLPPAKPERKRGFWWAIEKGEKGYSAGNFRCSVCGEPNVSYISKPNFCPNCGADMRGEQDDKQTSANND